MSKNCELFINLCNFMKFLLNEILPEIDPTDSVKDAAQDVLLAIIKYSKKIECELVPIFVSNQNELTKANNNSLSINAKCEFLSRDEPKEAKSAKSQKVQKKLQVRRLPLISIKAEPVSTSSITLGNDVIDGETTETTEKEVLHSPEIRPTENEYQNFHCNAYNACTDPNNQHRDDVIVDNNKTKNTNVCFNFENKLFPSYNRQEPAKAKWINKKKTVVCGNINMGEKENLLSIHNKSKEIYGSGNGFLDLGTFFVKSSNDTEDIFFEENFLQLYFFADLETTCNSLEEKNLKETCLAKFKNEAENNSDDLGSSLGKNLEKLNCLRLSDENVPASANSTEVITHVFRAINECILTKVVREAHYCFKCDCSIETYRDLQGHVNNCESRVPLLKNDLCSIFDLCDVCSYSAVAPASKYNELMEYHFQSHETVFKPFPPLAEHSHESMNTTGSENRRNCSVELSDEELLSFINNMLKYKQTREKTTISPCFFAICLICKAPFTSPLEWSYHVLEYRHLILPNENIVTCTPCCLVLLGFVNQNIKKYLSASEHLSHCTLSNCDGRDLVLVKNKSNH